MFHENYTVLHDGTQESEPFVLFYVCGATIQGAYPAGLAFAKNPVASPALKKRISDVLVQNGFRDEDWCDVDNSCASSNALSAPLASSVKPNNPNLQYVGRWDLQDPLAPAFQWPGSSISFKLQCSSASTISASFDTHDTYTKFGVYYNEGSADSTSIPYQLVESGTGHTIQASVPSGSTIVTIVKTTEDLKADPAQGSKTMLQPPSIFHGLTIDQNACTISKAPQKQRRMQFVGDSITCGFGNSLKPSPLSQAECLAEASHTSVTNIIGKMLYEVQDTHESWSMQLARKFDAEAHIQCLSGIGVCKNGPDLSPSNIHNMTYFIDRTLPFTETKSDNMWDYSKFQPDVLVVNLGTNDFIGSTGPTAPTYESFQAHYVSFVTRIMANYDKSKTKVVLACGPMTHRQCPYIEAAAKLLAKDFQAGYVDVNLPKSCPGTGIFSCAGCAGHPIVADDAKMAELMVPLVQKLTGWNSEVIVV